MWAFGANIKDKSMTTQTSKVRNWDQKKKLRVDYPQIFLTKFSKFVKLYVCVYV